MNAGAPHRWGERLGLAEEASGWPRQAVSGQTLGLTLEKHRVCRPAISNRELGSTGHGDARAGGCFPGDGRNGKSMLSQPQIGRSLR
jgi:hypothetical protein